MTELNSLSMPAQSAGGIGMSSGPIPDLPDLSGVVDPKTKKALKDKDVLAKVAEIAPAIKKQMEESHGAAAPSPNMSTPPAGWDHTNPEHNPNIAAQGTPLSLVRQPGMPQNSGVAMIPQKKNTNTDTRVREGTTIQRDPMGVNAAMDTMSSRPEYLAAQQSDQDSQDQLNKLKMAPTNGWIRPLSALSDSLTGSHLAETAPDPAARTALLLKYQDDMDKRKQEMFKSLANSAAQFKTGTAMDKQTQAMQAMNGYNMGGGGLNARLARIPIAAGQDFDKQTANMTRSVEALGRGDRMLMDPSIPLTENTLNLAQQDISAALTASGVPTDSKLALDMQHSIAGIIQQAKTKWTGHYDPNKDDLRTQIPDIVNQIKKVLDGAREEYRDNINRQTDQIAKTYEPSYGSIPNLEQTVKGKVDYIKSRMPKSAGYSSTGEFQPPPPPPKVGEVVEGHQFLGGNPADPKSWKAM